MNDSELRDEIVKLDKLRQTHNIDQPEYVDGLIQLFEYHLKKATVEAERLGRVDQQQRFVGFLEVMNETIPPENHKKIVETWLGTETELLKELESER